MTGLVELVAVCRRFASRAETVVAVDGVSISLLPGEIVAVAGPSGSGKSTLLHIVLGWERPDEGTVVVDPSIGTGWAGIAMVPQELGLLPELTGGQNVGLAARLARGADSVRTQEAIADLGLGSLVDRLPGELSLGEQQRFAVARAVAAGPRLLVADEPTSHQDETNADRVMAALGSVAASGGAVFVATHDDRLLDRADRIVRLRDGRVLAS